MAEKEYIEREAAKECVKEHYDDAIIIALDKIPASDVQPVVLCKDCRNDSHCMIQDFMGRRTAETRRKEMSILIKGMEMPISCEECKFFAWKRGVGQHCAVDDRITFHATLDGFNVGYGRNGNCPLVPVPPHGRLIDAEKIYDAVEQRYRISSGIEHRCERDLLDLICAAPTVLEAEEGE